MTDISTTLAALAEVEVPTLGHFLEEGFCDPGIVRVQPEARLMAGVAHTLHLATPDALAVNRALLELPAGAVLVIEVAGGAHAPVGAVTAAIAVARKAAGIVVEAPVTDAARLRSSAVADLLPVYSRGLTARTTKRLGTSADGLRRPVQVGGVTVRTGDIVLGDENGVLVIDPATLDPDIVERARRSDADEPALLNRIARGADLARLLPTSPEATDRKA
jgi:4-hydroxy-4-methyl-2-oxoglutarate aldolase